MHPFLKRSGHAGRDGMIWSCDIGYNVVTVQHDSWKYNLSLGSNQSGDLFNCLLRPEVYFSYHAPHQLFSSADLICPIAQRYTFIYLFKHRTPFLHLSALSLHQPQHSIGLRVSHHNECLHSMRGLHLLLLRLQMALDHQTSLGSLRLSGMT